MYFFYILLQKLLSKNFLSLRKCRTGCLGAVARPAARDVHMVSMTLVIRVKNAFYRLAVNTDGSAGMCHGTFEGIHPFPLLGEAFAAGFAAVAGMLSAHHDVPFTAQALIVVGTVFHRTF